MKSIYVCQIYDSLSEKVIHTFMAANSDHARDQFRRFLDSVSKYSDPHNFKLLYVSCDEICETSSDCVSFIESNGSDVEYCEDVGFDVTGPGLEEVHSHESEN